MKPKKPTHKIVNSVWDKNSIYGKPKLVLIHVEWDKNINPDTKQPIGWYTTNSEGKYKRNYDTIIPAFGKIKSERISYKDILGKALGNNIKKIAKLYTIPFSIECRYFDPKRAGGMMVTNHLACERRLKTILKKRFHWIKHLIFMGSLITLSIITAPKIIDADTLFKAWSLIIFCYLSLIMAFSWHDDVTGEKLMKFKFPFKIGFFNIRKYEQWEKYKKEEDLN